MFLKKIVQISLFAFISSVSINAAYSGGIPKSNQYFTEFTPVIPLPPVSNTAYSNICTGGVMIQEMSLDMMNGMGGGGGQMPPPPGSGGGQMPGQPGQGGGNLIDSLVTFKATTRLAYNDPTGVNNDVCRTIPLNANLVFLTTAITQNGNPRIDPSKNSDYGKALSNASSLDISGVLQFRSTSTDSVCLKTSHLSNSGGVVLLKAREICDLVSSF